MPLQSLLILLITHGLPIFLFLFMSIDILLRNHRKLEHILVACLCLTYFLMFLGEVIRNLTSIDYSPLISSAWFSSLGLFSLSIAFHYIMHISKLAEKLPKWLNPYIFYLPVVPILINIIAGAQLFSTQTFVEVGMWIYPIYDANYYATMVGSAVANFLIILPLIFAYKKVNANQKSLYRSLIMMFSLIALCNLILGLVNVPELLPPYPYLYAGLIFCFYLRKIMQSTEFLQQYDKHYEKLFTINPDAILLLDNQLNLRELNPVAQAFLKRHNMTLNALYHFLTPNVHQLLNNREAVRDFEFILKFDEYEYDFLLSIDHVTIELEPHLIIIARNITTLKEQQREIEFLAYHDALTKLPNRRYFFEKVDAILLDASVNGHVIAIYLLDINNLKMLNDLLGHEAGDQSIRMLASLLNNTVDQFGIAARVGGDEFIVCLNETRSQYNPDLFMGHIQTQFAQLVTHFENIPVGTSIGYSHFPTDSENIDTLVKLADDAMYEMKKLKKVQYR